MDKRTKKRINSKAHEILSMRHFSEDPDKYCGCAVGTVVQTSPSLVFSENDFDRIDAEAESERGLLGIEFKWREEPLCVRYYGEGCYVDVTKLEELAAEYGPNGLFIAFWPVADSVFVWETTEANMVRWRATLCERELPKDNCTSEKETERVYLLPFSEAARRYYLDAEGWEVLLDEYKAMVRAANGITS